MSGFSSPRTVLARRAMAIAAVAAVCGITMAVAVAVDDQNPQVKIVSPRPGEVVSGNRIIVTVEYFSRSGAPIQFVELWVDGKRQARDKLGTPRTSGRVQYAWNGSAFSPGMHGLEALAEDTKGYQGTAVVSVTLAAAGQTLEGISPFITVRGPRNGEKVSGRLTISVDVQPGKAEFVYLMQRDPAGKQDRVLAATTQAPYEFNLPALPEGTQQVYAVAKTGGGEIQSEVLSFEVVGRGGGTYTPQELPAPNLTPTAVASGPELALPELPLPPRDAQEVGGGLVGGTLVLASAGAVRVISTPRPMAPVAPLEPQPVAVVQPAPVIVQPAPALAPALPEPSLAARAVPAPALAPVASTIAAAPKVVAQPEAIRPKAMPPAAAAPVVAGPASPMGAVAAVARVDLPKVTPAPMPVEPPSQVPPVAAAPSDGTPGYVRSAAPVVGPMRIAAAPEAAAVATVASSRPLAPSVDAGAPPAAPVARMAQAAQTSGVHKPLIRIHVVRAGETLQAVSRRYGVSASRIAQANNLPVEGALDSGSRLLVPPQTTILFDDVPIAFDVEPQIINGIAVAPIRHMLEAAGGTVYWIGDKGLVRAEVGDRNIEVQVGSREARVDEEVVLLDLAATMKRDRVIVPVRFVGKALDVSVRYDPATENVHIVSHKPLDASSSPAA